MPSAVTAYPYKHLGRAEGDKEGFHLSASTEEMSFEIFPEDSWQVPFRTASNSFDSRTAAIYLLATSQRNAQAKLSKCIYYWKFDFFKV